MKIKLIEPYGFCAGVELVLDKINKIIEENVGEPIYCIGEIVHNKDVVQSIKKSGVIVLRGGKSELIDTIESGVVIFSAHGTDPRIVNKAIDKGLKVYDCVCPFVKKAMNIIERKAKDNHLILYIGVEGHEEAEAALSLSDNVKLIKSLEDIKLFKSKRKKISLINQTTLSIDDLSEIYSFAQKKYNTIEIEDEICNSTRIRQTNLKNELSWADFVVVVGDLHSNNTRSLYKIAISNGKPSKIVEKVKDLNSICLDNKNNILIVSGASTSRENVEEIYKFLKK